MKALQLLFLLCSSYVLCQDIPHELQDLSNQIKQQHKAEQTKVESYSSGWYTRIDDLLSNVNKLPSIADQQQIHTKLTAATSLIEQTEDRIKKRVENAYTPLTAMVHDLTKLVQEKKVTLEAAQQQIKSKLADAKTATAKALAEWARPVETLLRQTELVYKTKKRPIDAQKAQQRAQKEQAYKKRMRALFAQLGAHFPALERANIAERHVLQAFVATQHFDTQAAAAVTKQYKTVLQQFATIYKQGAVAIAFNEKTNYVAITLRRLIQFYLDDCSTTIRLTKHLDRVLTREKKEKNSYYKQLYDLVQRINGTGHGQTSIATGYNGIVASLGKQLFPQEIKAVTDYFASRKSQTLLNALGSGLSDFSIHETDPSTQALEYAHAIYQELMQETKELSKKDAQSAEKQANGYMAAIYLNLAQATIKKMEPKKDTTALLASLTSAYQTCSDYFAKAGQAANAQQYERLAKHLVSAQQFRKAGQKAEKQGNTLHAARLYKQAFDDFSVGGDTVDAAQMDDLWNELNAKGSVAKGQKTLHDFVGQYKTKLQAYMTAVSAAKLTSENLLSRFDDLLTGLGTTCIAAAKAYNNAISSFEKLEKDTTFLQDSIVLLEYVDGALKLLKKGDSFAELGSAENLVEAEYTHYAQALYDARKADSLYTEKLAPYIFIAPATLVNDQITATLGSKQAWNFELLFNRHIAQRYREIAKKVDDQLLATQYLAAANGTRMLYLSPDTQNLLATSLETRISDTKIEQSLLQYAEKQQKAASALTKTDWQHSTAATHVYISKADIAWQDTLKQWATLYRFATNKTFIRKTFLTAVKAYAQSYSKQVPQEFYPSIGTALITYRTFVVKKVANETASAETLQEIEALAKTFFQKLKTAQQQIANPDLLSSATDNQKRVVAWKDRFEQAVTQQNAILAELAPKANTKTLQLFTMTTDPHSGNISCVAKDGDTVFASSTIANPVLKLADMYKRIADESYQKADYKTAHYAYHYAQNYYNRAGKLDAARQAYQRYKKVYTRSIYHAYLALVVPNKLYQHDIPSIKVADISVPQHYELYNSLHQIPKEIPIPVNLSKLANDRSAQTEQQIQNLLLGYAYLVFLEKKLKDVGFTYAKVVDQAKQPPQLKKLDQIATEFSKKDLPLVIGIMQEANYYQKKLQSRLEKGKSSIHLLQRKESLLLAISYEPLLAATSFASNPYMTQAPYKGYFPADTYYSAIRALANPHVPTVRYGKGHVFVSGDEEAVYDQALVDLANSDLSAATHYHRKIAYLFTGGTLEDIDPAISYEEMATLTGARQQVEQLKKVDKKDFSIQLRDYETSLDIVKSYAKGIVDSYFNGAYIAYQQQKASKELSAISKALGLFYLWVARQLQLFLVGDPHAMAYFYGRGTCHGGLIVDIQKFYQLAYWYDNTLLDEAEAAIATMYKASGDLVVEKKNYFGALTYYQFAVSAYHLMKKPDEKQFTQAKHTLLNVYFKGSMEQLETFRNALIKTVKLPGAEGKAISLEALIKDVQLNPGTIGKAEGKTAQLIHDALLDATIYFTDCSAWASMFAFPQTSAQNKQQKAAITKKGKALLQSYFAKHGITFKTADSVIAMLKRADFVSLMQGIFDGLSTTILQTADEQERLGGFAALQQLTNTLYFALGKLYMHFYLGAYDHARQVVQWTTAIKTERTTIVAPPEQWLGEK